MKALKPILAVVLLLVLAFAAVPNVGAQAQGGLTYTSGVQVQNLGSATANITITFYNQDGTQAGNLSDTIGGSSSKTYFPVQGVSAGFNGSAVVSSDQPVAAIMNLLANNGAYAGSATGLTAGSTNVGIPLIMRNNGGFSTWFNVQNTGTTATTVTVSYKPAGVGNVATEQATIQPGAAKTFDQFTNTSLGDKFVGSASVSSDQPVAVMVNQVGVGSVKSLLTYDGFAAGSTSVSLPLIMANNSGFFTGISVQNVGSAATTVTIDYGPNTAGTFDPANETFTLQPGEGRPVLQSGAAWTSRYVGSATVTADQPLVAVVNQLRTGAQVGTAYEGFNPTNLTTKVSIPLLMANNGGFSTGLQCQNAGTSAITIDIDYSANTAGSFNPADVTGLPIAPGASVTVLQSGPAFGTNRYVGGATVTANGGNVACIVNQLGSNTAADQFLTYDGINF